MIMRESHDGKRDHGDAGPAPGRSSAAAPGRSTLVDKAYGTIHRKASGSTEAGNPGDAFALATSGPASGVPYQSQMERAFGRSFAGVQAHLGGAEAAQGLGQLGAHAAAHGQQIAFRDAAPTPHLVAHELAHVVQQSGGGGGVQCKTASVSAPGSDAGER